MFNEILYGIILGLLSTPISIIKKPRFFWGSAGFDPISFFWVLSFFLYGPLAAFISSLIGAFSIAIFSKEPTPILGAILKFCGTLSVWLTFYLILLFSPTMLCSSIYFNELSIFIPAVILAAIMRCLIEIPACLFAIPYFLSVAHKETVTIHSMVEKFGGLVKYFLSMVSLNFWLTIVDSFIPWIVVFPTGIYNNFGMW